MSDSESTSVNKEADKALQVFEAALLEVFPQLGESITVANATVQQHPSYAPAAELHSTLEV